MKILILNYEHPPIGGGGGRLAAKVGSGLVARGHRVRVLTCGMDHLPKEAVEEGLEVRRLRAFRRREDTCSVPEMAAWVVAAFPAVIHEIREWKPDVIHVHFAVPTGVVAWVAHQLTGVPYVLTAHLGDVPGGVPEQTGSLFRWIKPMTVPIWKSAAAVTAVSSFVADLAREAYGVSPEVVLNGITLPPSPELQTCQPVQLIMAGRMSVQKNPLLAVQALGILRDIRWFSTFIGDGPLLEEAKAEASRLGISDRIFFPGWLPSSKVTQLMEQSGILLIPSLAEGLPMVAVEALAHGLAIVGSRIGGLDDVVTDGRNGRLFNLSDGPEGLATVLKPLLLDPEVLLAARKESLSMASRFDLERSLNIYESVLQTAVGKR